VHTKFHQSFLVFHAYNLHRLKPPTVFVAKQLRVTSHNIKNEMRCKPQTHTPRPTIVTTNNYASTIVEVAGLYTDTHSAQSIECI
jgi:hypothetical protein